MREIISLLLFICILAGCSLQPMDFQKPEETMSDRAGDLYFFRNEMVNIHENLYHTVSKAEFQREIDLLEKESDSLDSCHYLCRVRKLVAMIGDGHTSIWFSPKFYFPVSFKMFDDGIFVLAVGNSSDNEFIGRKLVKINGLNVDGISSEIMKKISAIVSRDNDSTLFEESGNFLMSPEILYGLDIISEPDQVCYEFSDGSKLNLSSIAAEKCRELNWSSYSEKSGSKTPFYIEKMNSSYSHYFPSEKTLYILYNSCQNDSAQSFRSFINSIFYSSQMSTVENIIIDLRNNGGGSSIVINPLLGKLFFRKSLNVYCITGRRTYSSAMMNAVTLKKSYKAVVVGQPTGGAPDSYGEVQQVNLPSGLTLGVSTKYFSMGSGNDNSLLPDYTVPLKSGDYLNCKDSSLEKCLLLIAK